MNYVHLLQLQAEQIFGNKSKADSWLNQPKTALGGSTPLKESQKLSKNLKTTNRIIIKKTTE